MILEDIMLEGLLLMYLRKNYYNNRKEPSLLVHVQTNG